VGPAKVDKREATLKLMLDFIGEVDSGDLKARVLGHVDKANTAIGRGHLVLDSTLHTEVFCFHEVSKTRDSARE